MPSGGALSVRESATRRLCIPLRAPGKLRVQLDDHLPQVGHSGGQLGFACIALRIPRKLVNRGRDAVDRIPRVRTHRRRIAHRGRGRMRFDETAARFLACPQRSRG